MEKFKIYGYTNLTANNKKDIKEVVITDSLNLSKFSSYDENLSVSENDKVSFSFKILEKVNGEQNPFLDLLKPESVIALHLPDRDQFSEAKNSKKGAFYKLKIKERTPSFYKESIEYSINAEDFASQVYSKQGAGLAIEMTGTLREIAEEILGQTRKNNLYRNLNMDISQISLHDAAAKRAMGISYNLPYINYRGITMGVFTNFSYATFMSNDKYVDGEKYDLRFDLVGIKNTLGDTITNMSAIFRVVGRDLSGNQVFVSELVPIDFKGAAVPVRVPFTYNSNAVYIDLMLLENQSKEWPIDGVFDISMSSYKITKNKDKTIDREEGDTALFINHLSNFYEQFSTSNGSYYSEIKMTFSIDNSNLYHSLVALATLFNAEVKFDYQDNAFYFVAKDYREFKGMRIHPEINLSSITRPESTSEFATILHVQGGDDVEGAIPALPTEWRQYLAKCVENNFSTSDWFLDYTSPNGYKGLIPEVTPYIDPKANREERVNEIKKFAEQLDKIPNFESTMYNFDYFRKTDIIPSSSYLDLIDTLYNKVRKLNISLNINTYKYYSIYSDYSSQLLQLNFYISAVNTERKFQYEAHQKVTGDNAPKKYTSAWISYMNQIDASIAAEQGFLREIDILLGLRPDGHLDFDAGSFAYNSLILFGFKNIEENGIVKLLDENRAKRDKKHEEKIELEKKIIEWEEILEDPNVTSYVKETIAVDLAGARRKIDDISKYLGQTEASTTSAYFMPGVYVLEAQFYQTILDRMELYPSDIPQAIKNSQSLYDLVINRESPNNLVVKKELELQVLMDKYDAFALEARYENAEETDAASLLEQAAKTFVTISYPKVSYNIGVISIGALDEYSYMKHPEIGDKILLPEDLYLSYDNEDTKYLVVTGYNESLRDPSTISLDVEKDDESEILVARMLEQTNFLKLNAPKKKSNYVAPIPQDLRHEISNISESLDKLRNSDLSIVSLFDEMIKK